MNNLHMYLVENLHLKKKQIKHNIILIINNLHAANNINPVTIKSNVKRKQINGP
jgi:hypothetical protein